MTVFARVPALGRVKSRLAASVGDAHALGLYTWLGARVVRGLTDEPARTWDVHVAYTPADGDAAVRAWLGPVEGTSPQVDGDLGARMAAAVDEGLAAGYRAVVLVGTDCAAVTASRVAEAIRALADHDAVLGPATDGGYYLLGMSRRLPVFDGVAWSTETVAEATRARLTAAGGHWLELATETDVDTEADLRALRGLPDAPGWVR